MTYFYLIKQSNDMKRINYAHNFRVKFDRVFLFVIKTWGWSMALFLVWFLTSIFRNHEKVALKAAPWYFIISFAILLLGNTISWIAGYLANRHFKKYSWAQ